MLNWRHIFKTSILVAVCGILIFISSCRASPSPSPVDQTPATQAPSVQAPTAQTPVDQTPFVQTPIPTQTPTPTPTPAGTATTVQISTRDQIEEQYKWRLQDIYASDDLWEEDFARVKESIPAFKAYEGRLGDSALNLSKYINLYDEVNQTLEKVYWYAYLHKDEDMANTTYQALFDRAFGLYTEFNSFTSFAQPEILAIEDRKMADFIRQSELAPYKFYIENIVRMKPHVLSTGEEKLLAQSQEVLSSPENIFGLLTGTDFTWPSIKDDQGQEVELSRSRYSSLLTSTDRRVRKEAYDAYLTPFESFKNTLASLYSTEVKSHIFMARARGYNSSLESYLEPVNIPVSIYTNLISAVHRNLAALHAWTALKKKVLGLDEMRPYDVDVTLFPAAEKTYTYEEAQTLIRAALKPLGEEYAAILDKGFHNGWIDLYATQNKFGGAGYSAPIYQVHAYILLNCEKNLRLDDVLGLAHEMGHAVNQYIVSKNQPYVYCTTVGFYDEVASLTNEILVLNYLLQNAGEAEKLPAIEAYLNMITLDLYNTTRYAEFEKLTHEKAENGEALTPDTLSQLWSDLIQQYRGPEMKVNPDTGLEWGRIPHFFYYNFYCYNYATSVSAAEIIAQKILAGDDQAIRAYLDLLSKGASDYPVELLKKAGADMSSPEPIDSLGRKMGDLVAQMESRLARK